MGIVRFYSTAQMKPPLGVKVKVVWNGRHFVAARVAHPATKRECWIAEVNRIPVFLPADTDRPFSPSAPWVGFGGLAGTAPELWAPLCPDKWQVPLPEPACEMDEAAQPRMWASKQEFNAAEAAAEMERDRADVSRETPAEAVASRVAWQWWRDASQIRYEPATALSERMAEGRLMRAVACCGAGKGLTLRAKSYSTIIVAIAETLAGADDMPANDPGIRFEPLPQDHDDFDTAMRWFAGLNPVDMRGARHAAWSLSNRQTVLVLRSMSVPWSFDEIGDHLQLSGERCRQINVSALKTAWKIGRGDLDPLSPQIAKLRERNRRARRGVAA